MRYQYLTDTPIETIQKCMQDSFADYQVDMSYMTVDVMKHRNAICRNNPDCSVGAFNDGKMIGFLNVGIDYINDELIAFDGGTGIVKEYRGRGIAGEMFAKSLDSLKKLGAQKFMLEVLQPNKSAIRAYEKEGFTISRSFKCYDLDIKNFKPITQELGNIDIVNISVDELERYWHYIQYPVSWEHMYSGLKAIDNDIIIKAAFNEKHCIGFIIYDPVLCWITGIGIAPDYNYYEQVICILIDNLLKVINPTRPLISLNNIMENDRLNEVLINLGFKNPIDQYEMIADI